MATQQIPTNPQNSNHNPMAHITTGNPIADAVTALRGIVKTFKGKDKEFEALFALTVDGLELQAPTTDNCGVWADALLYLVETDPDSRRSVIVEDIARRLLQSAYGDNDDLPPPPQYTAPTQSEEPSSQPPAKDPIISPRMDKVDFKGNLILCNVKEASSDSLPLSLRHGNIYDAISEAQQLFELLRELCTAMDNKDFVFESWGGLSLMLDFLQDKMEIATGEYKFPLSDYTNDSPALVKRRHDW